ncbi:MAG: hypothetical protein Q7U27_27075 [Pseudomonas sp.]|uniref:hypothetical protein n=1 Tax=Pseudomonas sp. TaxID=306 RepID=UPI0027276716|nr:hypothetical protein [Pseudomonas sp.]MDO9332373.1 hypothetical protein [Pseudomonas sp.]
MNARRNKLLGWTIFGAAVSAFVGTVIKMLVTDQWPLLRPLVSTGWDRTLAVFTWLDQTAALPHWVVIIVPLMMLFLMAILVWSLNSAGEKLIAAQAKIAELRTPSVPPLTKNQDKVIGAIAIYGSAGKRCPTKEFPAHIDLTFLEVDGALDVLEARKMVSFEYATSGRYVTLTAVGRAYVLRPDFDIGAATATH